MNQMKNIMAMNNVWNKGLKISSSLSLSLNFFFILNFNVENYW